MLVKGIIDEDFVNYKKPCMTIMFPKCDFKCDKECGIPVCQNSELVKQKNIEIDEYVLARRYLNNPITHAICMQGLEPFDSFPELHYFIVILRDLYYCDDPIIIYTGYNKEEVKYKIDILSYYSDIGKNIIIKYGRYIPNQQPHYDEVLGVMLASDNQYAERIS